MIDCCATGRTLRLLAGVSALAALCSAQPNLGPVVERARREFDVPGIAVAIVKDGKVVLARGYGVRRIGQPAPVTARSLFRIASNTKAFTAAALAILVDEGKIHWDDRVIDHLPAFQMYDPYVTREIAVRDLLVHRSGLGLGAGDLMFFPSTDLSRDEIVHRLRFFKPATSFRSRYAYDNLLYLVAGQLIPAVTGQSWDDFVTRRIFAPLGMSSSGVSTRTLETASDVAIPHSRVEGKLVALDRENVDNNAPAGSIVSCVEDMARWLILQLNHGTSWGPSGRVALFSEAQSREMWSPQTVLPMAALPSGSPAALAAIQPNFDTYGLGWHVRDLYGKKMVTHNGGLSGYVSRVTLIPELQLGIVVLTNQEATGAFEAVTYTILDHYFGRAETDWVAVFRDLEKKEQAEAAGTAGTAAAGRNPDSRPSLPLAAYAGRYRDAWYGDILIEERAGKLVIRFSHTPALAGTLEHWQYDTFVARWNNRTLAADAFVTFSLKPDGAIGEVRMLPVSPLTDFSFDFQDLLLRPAPSNAPPR
jgi:CubicO group peptidase (beta-lactamase class C family)